MRLLRLSYGFEYSADLETVKDKNTEFPFETRDTYDWYLRLGALSHADERYFHGKMPTWENFVAHPDRDEFWQRRAIGGSLTHTAVPDLNVAGWWDQEDFVGPLDIYARLEKTDAAGVDFLVVGPWNHGGWSNGDGRKLGVLDFGSDTAREFRRMQARWFAHWLYDEPMDLHEATVFVTGADAWRSFDGWPPPGAVERRLYLHAGGKASFDPPVETGDASDAFVSDPAHPVPYRHRPIGPTYPGPEWPVWLLEDQRFVDQRPDVLTWQTDVLDHDVVVAGDIVADLRASTTGTDADWVVKLIDVYPDGVAPPGKEDDPPHAGAAPHPPDMRGYELIVADEIFRARFREGFDLEGMLRCRRAVSYPIDLRPQRACLPRRPPHHGAGAEHVVSALRPQSPAVRAEHLPREGRGLRESDAPRAPVA